MKKVLLIIVLVCSFLFSFAPTSSAEVEEVRAYQIMKQFVTLYPHRLSGTEQQKGSGEWIKNFFEGVGYDTIVQEFSYEKTDSIASITTIKDANIIAKKFNASRYTVVIGAHYDNVFSSGSGQGAYDNGSGIGVMLALCENLFNYSLDYNLTFVAFGAEEYGLYGSNFYVQNLSPIEKDEIILYVNLDSICVGDYLYMYCDEVETHHENYFLSQIKQNYLKINSMPAYKGSADIQQGDSKIPYTHPALCSDQASFFEQNIMSVGFYSFNVKKDSLEQVNESLTIPNVMHTPQDRVDYIESVYGKSAEEKMSDVYALLNLSLLDENFLESMIYARVNNPDYSNLASGKIQSIIALGVIVILIIIVSLSIKFLRKKAIKTVKEEQLKQKPPKVFGDFE